MSPTGDVHDAHSMSSSDGDESDEEMAVFTEAGRQSTFQHRSLVCTLRPYQARAVEWMVARERGDVPATMGGKASSYAQPVCMAVNSVTPQWESKQEDDSGGDLNPRHHRVAADGVDLHPLWTRVMFADGQLVYVNMYAGLLCREPIPSTLDALPGGILADQVSRARWRCPEPFALPLLAPVPSHVVTATDGPGKDGGGARLRAEQPARPLSSPPLVDVPSAAGDASDQATHRPECHPA